MNYLSKITKFYKQVLGRFPQKIPVGLTDFQAWIEDIRNTYPMPTPDQDSIIFSVSNMVMHLGPLEHRKSKYFFYKALHAGASKQVAAYCFTQIKTNFEAAQRAKQDEPKKAEVTAPTLAVVSNEAPQ